MRNATSWTKTFISLSYNEFQLAWICSWRFRLKLHWKKWWTHNWLKVTNENLSKDLFGRHFQPIFGTNTFNCTAFSLYEDERDTIQKVFYCKFCEISKNNFERLLLTILYRHIAKRLFKKFSRLFLKISGGSTTTRLSKLIMRNFYFF